MGLLGDYLTGSGQARAQKAARAFAGQNFTNNLDALRTAAGSAERRLTEGTDAAIRTLEGARDAAGRAIAGGGENALGYLEQTGAGAGRALAGARDALERAMGSYDPLDRLARRYDGATGLYLDALGLNGPEGQARARSAMDDSLASRFELEQGLEAINRGRAARGGGTVSGGNIDRDTQLFGQNLAHSRSRDYLDRLQGFVAPQLQATGAAAEGRAGVLGNLAGLFGQEAGLGERLGLSRAQIAAETANRLAALASGTGSGVADLQDRQGGRLAELARTLGGNEIGLRQAYERDLVASLLAQAQARSDAGGRLVDLGAKGFDLLKSLVGASLPVPGGGAPAP